MKVLLATATFPTPDRPSAGIFVRNQYRFFRRHATPEESFVLFRVRTHSKYKARSWTRVIWSTLKFIPHFFRHYDIVHVHFLSPLIHAANLYKKFHPRTILLVTVHGSGLRNIMKRSDRTKRRYHKALQNFDEIIIAGETLMPAMQKELGIEKTRIVCAGVDDLRFHVNPPNMKEFDFIFVGSFTEHKGVDILLSALELTDIKELRVCFVGSGPLKKQIQLAGHHLNIQVFMNVPQTQLRQLYSASRFLVFPSRGDGFGLVVSEAMYCGVPAIIYAGSGAGAQVQNKISGLTYKPNTAEKLGRVLRAAFAMGAEEYKAMSDIAGRTNLEFSLSHIGTNLMRLYRQKYLEKELNQP